MDPIGFQNILLNPKPFSDSLDKLIENWNVHQSEASDEITRQGLLHTIKEPPPVYSRMQGDGRRTQTTRVWWHSHNEASERA